MPLGIMFITFIEMGQSTTVYVAPFPVWDPELGEERELSSLMCSRTSADVGFPSVGHEYVLLFYLYI